MRMFTLPFPPSVNTYWRTPNAGPLTGRTMISQRGRAYRREAIALIACSGGALDGRLRVVIHAFPPDNRKRDLDNMLKAVLDALKHGGAIVDDSDIDSLWIIREKTEAPGRVIVHVEQME